MAIYGNNSGDGYALRGVSGNSAKGIPITISNSGETGASIHLRTDGTTAGCQLAVAIYDGSNNLVDSGSATVGASNDGDYISANLSGESLPAGNYVIMARVDESDVSAYFSDLANAGRQCDAWAAFPGWDDPETIDTDSRDYDIYLTTNEPASAATLSTPTATSITQTTATIGCTTDNATGTLYGVVTTSATPPSEAQVAAGQDHTGATAAASGTNASLSVGANTIDVTGLTADTTYYSHFVQDIGSAEYSNVLSSTSWNTLEVVNSPAISAGAITNRTVDGFTIGFTTDTANGTAYYAVYTTSTARNAATAQDIVDESTSLDAAVAAGSKAVTVAEAQTFTAVSGLDPDTPYYVAIVHYGDAQA